MNETEARELLRRAASTIDVPPGRELVGEPGRPRWLVPAAAAAAVVVAIAGGVLLIGGDDEGPSPADGTRLPDVLAWKLDEAERALEDAGFDVDVTTVTQTCEPPGRVRGLVRDGKTVRIVTSQMGLAPVCGKDQRLNPNTPALDLLDFAAGQGPVPRFAGAVTVVNDGTQKDVLYADEPGSTPWADATLSHFREGLSHVAQAGGVWTSTYGGRPVLCGSGGLGDLDTRAKSFRIAISSPSAGCAVLDVYADRIESDGALPPVYEITAIAVRTSTTGPMVPAPRVPDVVGLDADQATRIVQDLGATAEVRDDPDGCADPGMVTGTAPAAGEPLPLTRVVEILVCAEESSRVDPEGRELAQRFEAFATGTLPHDSLPIDTPVDLYLGNTKRKTISAADTGDPAAYNIETPGYAGYVGPFSAVETIRRDPEGITYDVVPRRFVSPPGQLLRAQDAGGDGSVFLNSAGTGLLDSWSVQLIFNHVGQIVAVNLLISEP